MGNTKTQERKVVTLASLDALEGEAKKQFDSVLKARDAFIKACTSAPDVPAKYIRVLRREMNAGIKQGSLQDRKKRLQERIAKMNERLASLDK